MVTLDGAVISVETWHRSNKRCEPYRGAHGLLASLALLSGPSSPNLPPPRDARKGMRTQVGSEFSSPVSVPIKARTRALGVSQASQEGFWRRLLKYLRAGTLCSLPFCPLLRGQNPTVQNPPVQLQPQCTLESQGPVFISRFYRLLLKPDFLIPASLSSPAKWEV